MGELQGAQAWYHQTYNAILRHIEDVEEAHAITEKLLECYLGYTKIDYLLNRPLQGFHNTHLKLQRAYERIRKQEPVQYILGSTYFFNQKIKVNEHVFIPRPETEELIQSIIDQETQKRLRFLDIGTGSGCIAIALAKIYPNATIDALDKNPQALVVAKNNAILHSKKITFHHIDILHEPLPKKQWDIIVSNPPYIPLSEKASMHPRVVHYEPSEALFVPDNNPLVFYKKIAHLATKHLLPMGTIFVEIHENFSHAIKNIFQENGFQKVDIHRDLHNKERWVVASQFSSK